jgi:hypothetical protein
VRRRFVAFVAIGAVLAAVAIGAVAGDARAPRRDGTNPSHGAAVVGATHRLSAITPVAPKVGIEILRRASGLRGDFTAATLAFVAIAIGIAMRLRRERRPLHSPHILQSIVRGRSPPRLLVVP